LLLRHPHNTEDCRAVSEILQRVGDKWTVLVVGKLGAGPLRFNELRAAVGGISQKMLTTTLRGLERDGFVTRTVFPTIPPRVDYELLERYRPRIACFHGVTGYRPVHRLLREVDQWNLATKKGYELSFNWALAPYVTGSDAEDVLRAVDRKMYSKKHKLTPVF